MIDSIPGTPRLAGWAPDAGGRADAGRGACGGSMAGRRPALPGVAAARRPCRRPCVSAVSATTAPATPGMAVTTRSAAARSGSSSFARSAGTVIEKNTFRSAMKMSETRPRLTMSPSKSGPLMVASRWRTTSLVTDIALFLLAGADIVQNAARTKRAGGA